MKNKILWIVTILPAIIVLFTLFWLVFMKYYKKKANNCTGEKAQKEAENNIKVLNVVAIAMAGLFGVMQCIFLIVDINEGDNNMTSSSIDMNALINIAMGVFIIIIGSLLPKTKLNAAVGIRTIWSIENDKTWAASNRVGGFLCVIAGILTIIKTAIVGGIASSFIMLAIILGVTIISVVYSYKAYKKYK